MSIDFIKLDKSKIETVSTIIANEFETSPVVRYIFPEKEVRNKVLPLLFESLLTVYQDIGTTYITLEDIEFTFSLINTSKSFNNILVYSSILKTIPNSIHALFSMHLIEATKKIIHIEESLKEAFDYVSQNDNYLFLSSIAAKNPANEKLYLDDMIKFCINEAKEKGMKILVETETKEMVNFYSKHGFKVGRECKLKDEDIWIYILAYDN